MRGLSVRYDGPPELFTMYACLFADMAVQSMSTAWRIEHVVELRSRMLSYVKEFGFTPHPGVLVTMVRKGE